MGQYRSVLIIKLVPKKGLETLFSQPLQKQF
jgi:hypothetical protein